MIQIIPVKEAYASMTCDWAGCTERIDLPVRPADLDRDIQELTILRFLAKRRGWEITNDMDGEVVCPNHPTEAA